VKADLSGWIIRDPAVDVSGSSGRAAIRRPLFVVHHQARPLNKCCRLLIFRMMTLQQASPTSSRIACEKRPTALTSLFAAKTIPAEDDSYRLVPDLTFAAHVNLNA
jgi:hypothetical protein